MITPTFMMKNFSFKRDDFMVMILYVLLIKVKFDTPPFLISKSAHYCCRFLCSFLCWHYSTKGYAKLTKSFL